LEERKGCGKREKRANDFELCRLPAEGEKRERVKHDTREKKEAVPQFESSTKKKRGER